jgi:hypothetical protein
MNTKTQIIGLFLTGWMLTTPSCTQESDFEQQQPSEQYTVIQEDYSFFADHQKYKEADTKRAQGDLCNVEWKIIQVQRTGNELALQLSKPKDCKVRYEFIWNGILMESFPMMAHILVKAVGENCVAEEYEEEVITVELDTVFKNLTTDDIANTNFTVRDACSLEDFNCTDDCNTSISN